MKVLAAIQHTSAEYLGLMEDHLEGRRIRFHYSRPFTGGRKKLPHPEAVTDGLVLLGGGPWGSAGGRDLPTLTEEIDITRTCLKKNIPVVGIGLGAQILAIAAGGGSTPDDLVLEVGHATRTRDDALNGFLPERYPLVVYMRDRPELPAAAQVLAVDESGLPALFQIGDNAFGFTGHPGIKAGIVEDLIMEFEEVPADTATGLEALRGLQREIEDSLVSIMTGLIQLTGLMRPHS